MSRRNPAAAAVVAALLVAGCSPGRPPKPDPTPSASGPDSTRSAASATATTTAAASPTPTPTPTPDTVPVDEIPPGRPASWIPAGMPTAAPWREPGDVLPMFTLAMFEDTPAGAVAAARFYIDARNWAFATLDPTAFLLVCKSEGCQRNANRFRHSAAVHEHIVGGRFLGNDPVLRRAPHASAAEWVVRVNITIEAGQRVDASGSAVETQPQASQINDLYMHWGGKRWIVNDDALGQ